MHRSPRHPFLTLPIALLACLAPRAQNEIGEVLPSRFATTPGGNSTSFPFASSGPMRAMYAYGADTLGIDQPVRLRGIAFRPAAGANFGPVEYDLIVNVSTSRNEATNLDHTFENNHSADKTEVFDGRLAFSATPLGSTPNDFVLYIPFSKNFTWNPRFGPLLVDLQSRGIVSGSNFIAMDVVTGTADVGRIVHRSDSNAATADFPTFGTQAAAMVAKLDFDYQVAPASLATTEGNTSSSYPWNRPVGTGMRVQYAYDGSTFDLRGRTAIHRLAFRTDSGGAFGGRSFDCKITMSTGAPGLPSTINANFAANHGADAKVVFDGVLDAPAALASSAAPGAFVLEVPLTESFSYNPAAGSLVVDFQLRSSTGATGRSFDGSLDSSGNTVARVYQTNDPDATSGTPQSFGLTMAISGYPQPTLPEALDSVAGNSSSSFPWNTSNPMRVMYEYGANALQLQEPQQITHLRFRPDRGAAIGPVAYDCTVDLSTRTAGAGALNTTFDLNHGSDRHRAFNGKASIAMTDLTAASVQPWVLEIRLDEPFRWDPSLGPLIVDVRLLEAIGNAGIPFDGSFNTNINRIAHRSDPDAATADFGPQAFGLALSLNSEACGGVVETYGSGCPNGNGLVPFQATRGLPTLPNPDFAFRLVDATPSAVCAMLMGTAPTAVDLSIIGANGCTLHTNPNIASFPRSTDVTGLAEVAIPLLDDPSSAGLTFFTSWAIVDLSANSLGVYTSDGMRTELCY